MRGQTQEQVSDYLAAWKERLGLDMWTIALSFENREVRAHGDLAIMSCERDSHYDRAVLHVSDFVVTGDWLPCIDSQLMIDDELEGELVERVIVHELLHIVMRDIVEVTDLVRDQLSGPVLDVWDGAFKQAEEQTVDRLAAALMIAFDRGVPRAPIIEADTRELTLEELAVKAEQLAVDARAHAEQWREEPASGTIGGAQAASDECPGRVAWAEDPPAQSGLGRLGPHMPEEMPVP